MDIILFILKLGGPLIAGTLGVLALFTQAHRKVRTDGRKKLNQWGWWAFALIIVGVAASSWVQIAEFVKKRTDDASSRKLAEQQAKTANASLEYLKRLSTPLSFLEFEVTYELPTNSLWATNLLHYIAPRTELAQKAAKKIVPSLRKSSPPATNAAAALQDSITFAAGAGIIAAPFLLTNGYIYQPAETRVTKSGLTNCGTAIYTFAIVDPGNYVVQCLVQATNAGAGSFYVNIDATPTDPYMIWKIFPQTSGFQEEVVNWQGDGTYDAPQFVPLIFNLTTGQHKLVIVGREANTQLRNISILKIPAEPTQLGVLDGDFAATPPPPPLAVPGQAMTKLGPSNTVMGEVMAFRQMPVEGKNAPYEGVCYVIGVEDINYGLVQVPVTMLYDGIGYFFTMEQYDIAGVRHSLVDLKLQTSIQFNSLTNDFWRGTITSADWRQWIRISDSLTNGEMHVAFWNENSLASASRPDISIAGSWSIQDARIVYGPDNLNLMFKVSYSASRNEWNDRHSIKAIADLANTTFRISSGLSAALGVPNKNLIRQVDLRFGASAITLTNLYPIQERGTNWVEAKLPTSSELLGSAEIK